MLTMKILGKKLWPFTEEVKSRQLVVDPSFLSVKRMKYVC